MPAPKNEVLYYESDKRKTNRVEKMSFAELMSIAREFKDWTAGLNNPHEKELWVGRKQMTVAEMGDIGANLTPGIGITAIQTFISYRARLAGASKDVLPDGASSVIKMDDMDDTVDLVDPTIAAMSDNERLALVEDFAAYAEGTQHPGRKSFVSGTLGSFSFRDMAEEARKNTPLGSQFLADYLEFKRNHH